MPAAYPAMSANTIILWGRWFDHLTRVGRDEHVVATPRFAPNQTGSITPNLRSAVDEADIKTGTWRTLPLRDTALWALPLLATNDTQFGAFGGYDVAAGKEPSVLVELLENAEEIVLDQEMVDALAVASTESTAAPLPFQVGDRVQALWVGHAAVLTTPAPVPVSGFLNAEQVTSLVATSTWRHRGPWSADTTYVRRDAVGYAGSSWLADAPSTGVIPGSDSTWRLLAAAGGRGDQGERGLAGNPGQKGDPGDRGAVGPAAALGVDTVTTGAAGSQASAQVTGTAPNQKLNLTIPRGDKGEPGQKGDPGAASTERGPQGPPGLVWRGPWSNVATYAVDDAVSRDGRSFVAAQSSTGVAPPSDGTNSSTWILLADRGSSTSELIVPVPSAFNVTTSVFANRYEPAILDLSRYPSAATVHLRADLSQGNPGTGLVEARLACMSNSNNTVANSTISASVAQYDHAIRMTGDIRAGLQAGTAIYSLEARTDSGFSGQVLSPQLVVRLP